MVISDRITSIESSAIRKMYDKANESSINLGIGMPFCNTPEHIKSAAVKAIEENKTFYTSNMGLPELRTAVAERYNKAYNLNLNSSNVLITAGVAEAIFLSLFLILEPGDEILLPNPGYMGYSIPASMMKGIIKYYPLYFENEFSIKCENVISNISERTRAVVLNSPSNPTGGLNTDYELSLICDYCSERGISVISDEVYSGLNYTEDSFKSVCNFMPLNKAMILNGVSKEYSMTGWRIGWIISSPDIIKQLVKVHQVMVSCSSSISQYAAIDAVQSKNSGIKDILDDNRLLMSKLLLKIPDIRFFIPKGGLYYFVDFCNYGDDVALADNLLKETNVITIPGSAFGNNGKGFLRLSFGAKPEKIEFGMNRIINYLNNMR